MNKELPKIPAGSGGKYLFNPKGVKRQATPRDFMHSGFLTEMTHCFIF